MSAHATRRDRSGKRLYIPHVIERDQYLPVLLVMEENGKLRQVPRFDLTAQTDQAEAWRLAEAARDAVADHDHRKWSCHQCGSEDIEARAFCNLNTSELVDWEDGGAEYWCAGCDETLKSPCEVDDAGHCHNHDQAHLPSRRIE